MSKQPAIKDKTVDLSEKKRKDYKIIFFRRFQKRFENLPTNLSLNSDATEVGHSV